MSRSMFTIKVFDPELVGWRDICPHHEADFGYCYTWDERSHREHSLVDAFELADALWFYPDEKVRAGVFSEADDPWDLVWALHRKEPISWPWPCRRRPAPRGGREPGTRLSA